MQSNCFWRVITLEDKVYLILQCWCRQPWLVYIWHLRLLIHILSIPVILFTFQDNIDSNIRYQVQTRLIITHVSFIEEFTFYNCILFNVMNDSFHIFCFIHNFTDRRSLFTYNSSRLTSGNVYFSALLLGWKNMWSTNTTRNQIAWFWNDFLDRL